VELVDIRSRKLHVSYGDFPVCKQRLKCRLCFPAQSAKRRRTQTKADFHLFSAAV